MIEGSGNPRVHRVTLRTVCAKATLVRLVLLMTGGTIPGRGLQIYQRARIGVTGVAVHFHVCAHQRKGHFAMIKMFVVSVHAIVTGKAVTAPT